MFLAVFVLFLCAKTLGFFAWRFWVCCCPRCLDRVRDLLVLGGGLGGGFGGGGGGIITFVCVCVLSSGAIRVFCSCLYPFDIYMIYIYMTYI